MIRLNGTVCLWVERNHAKWSVVKIPKRGIAEGTRPTGTGARKAISGRHVLVMYETYPTPDITASQSIVSFCCQRIFSGSSCYFCATSDDVDLLVHLHRSVER